MESALSGMWQERILVVNDDDAMSQALKDVLEKEGLVDVAITSEYALNYLDHDYCAIIVVNADSKGIDPVDFYGRTIALYPNIKNRFLFLTARGNPKHLAFFEKNGLRHVKELGELRKSVAKLLQVKS